MTAELVADVAVIGGGPAGSIAAACLAAAGLDTVLVDRPRPPVTRLQCIGRDAYRLLVELAGRRTVDDAVSVASSLCVRWARADASAAPVETQQLIVDREVLDPTLRAWAIRSGARFVGGSAARLRAVGAVGAAGDRYLLPVRTERADVQVIARAAVLAAGRAGALGTRRRLLAPRTIALVAEVALGPTADRGVPADLCVEALHDGWLWLARDGDRLLVVAVTAPIAKADAPRQVANMLHEASVLLGVERVPLDGHAVQVVDVTPSVSSMPPPARVHLVGDAAVFLDPLSGHGLSVAIRSAVQTVDALCHLGPDAARVEVVRDPLAVATEHHAMAQEYYRLGAQRFATPFWAARAGPITPGRSTREARRVAHVDADVVTDLGRQVEQAVGPTTDPVPFDLRA